MRAFATALLLLLIFHLLAAGGFIGWLYASDRINRDRIEQVIDLFQPTLAEQRAAEKAAAEQQEAEAVAEAEQERLEAVSEGAVSAAALVERRQTINELVNERMDKLDNDIGRLRQQMVSRERELAQQMEEFEAEAEAFEEAREAFLERTDDEDFERTVDLLQRQPPRQVKDIFLRYMEEGETGRVVDYLKAMRPAAAADVMTEFRGAEELEAAAELVRRLERHGADFIETHMDEARAEQ